jgi:hypothetical protein
VTEICQHDIESITRIGYNNPCELKLKMYEKAELLFPTRRGVDLDGGFESGRRGVPCLARKRRNWQHKRTKIRPELTFTFTHTMPLLTTRTSLTRRARVSEGERWGERLIARVHVHSRSMGPKRRQDCGETYGRFD